MERLVLERVRLDAQLLGVRVDVGERDPRRLLHHVAELTREDELVAVAAVHRRRLDEEDVATRSGDRESRRDPRHRRPLRGLLEELLAAERVAHDIELDRDRRLGLPGRYARRRLAENRAEL